ncbi:MAG: LptF/LptG family permease [Bacteroidales bacterium]|nr:LptF/LptG family permease [Bacteroidales bacterium]
MKKIHRLVFRSFLGPFFVVFFIALFVLLMQFMWRYVDELIGKGLDFIVVGEFLLYTTATLVPSALPLAILMSSLMTFGNLGEKYELTAMKASGISLQRIMAPMFMLVILLSFGEFFFANEVLPYSNEKLYTLIYDIRNKRPALQITEDEFYNGIDGYSIRVNKKNPETNKLYDILIYNHTENKGNVEVTQADSGIMAVTADELNLILTLWSGSTKTEMQDFREHPKRRTYPHRQIYFSEQEVIIKLSGFDLKRSEKSLFKDHHAMLDLANLKVQHDSMMQEIIDKQDELYMSLNENGALFKAQPSRYLDRNLRPYDRNPSEDEYSDTIATEADSSSTLEAEFLSDVKPDSILKIVSPMVLSRIYHQATSSAKQAKTTAFSTNPSIVYKTGRLRRIEIEEHRKFVLSFACLIFLLLGAPLGAIIRKGGLGLPLVISTLFFILWYIVNLTGEKMVRESVVHTVAGMWTPSIVFMMVGIFLTYKATTDSQMMNLETYSNFFKKIFGQRYRIIDVILKEHPEGGFMDVKKLALSQSIKSFHETVEEQKEAAQVHLKPFGFIVSLFGVQDTTDLIMFERLYKNIFLSIIESKYYNVRMVRSKLQEFPNFKASLFIDTNLRLIIKLALLFIPIISIIILPKHQALIIGVPIITILILLRHYILMITLKNRLQTIHQNTKELYKLIEQTEL